MEAGGAKTVALNAADEVAVAAFLEGKIPFLGIPATIQAVLNETPARKPESIYEVLGMDLEARELARRFVNAGASGTCVPLRSSHEVNCVALEKTLFRL